MVVQQEEVRGCPAGGSSWVPDDGEHELHAFLSHGIVRPTSSVVDLNLVGFPWDSTAARGASLDGVTLSSRLEESSVEWVRDGGSQAGGEV
ncbi:hypothetical protein ACFX2I_039921 [Malus domestica]